MTDWRTTAGTICPRYRSMTAMFHFVDAADEPTTTTLAGVTP